jgi:hypothetical protein
MMMMMMMMMVMMVMMMMMMMMMMTQGGVDADLHAQFETRAMEYFLTTEAAAVRRRTLLAFAFGLAAVVLVLPGKLQGRGRYLGARARPCEMMSSGVHTTPSG